MGICFGTDGWRAVIGDEFTFANVRLVAQAIADMLLNECDNGDSDSRPAVVIGYDTRFMSDRFAAEVGSVLAANGIDVHLSSARCPTPALAHAVRQFRACGGVMITASHNPPQFGGLKWKDATGGPAPKTATRQIEQFLDRNLRDDRLPRTLHWNGDGADYVGGNGTGFIRRFDPVPGYVTQLKRLVEMDHIAHWGPRVLVDPMCGAGCGLLAGLLRATSVQAMEIHGEASPLFGGICPEPIERNLRELSREVVRGHYDVGLALDGDGDRVGAIDELGRFIDPHRIFSLALQHLVENKRDRGAVVKTVSTTQMINRMCAQWGLPLHETPVGFNHICDIIRTEDVLIGGEESGGITIRGHIPDGDGILMALLLLEIMSLRKASVSQLVAELMQRFGPLFYERRDLATSRSYDKTEMVQKLVAIAPRQMAGVAMSDVTTADGAKFCFQDGSWLLIRPSGTEPVLRIYAESCSPDQVRSLVSEGSVLVQRCL
jgi:phosphomannomutase